MIKINKPDCPNPEKIKSDYKYPECKNSLIQASYGKCMYCESVVNHVYFGDIEHIKPKSIYTDLEFDWNNLGFVCAKCNNAKRDKYSEETPYINPYEENPDDYLIALGGLYCSKKGNERGELTILDIDLNRTELIERRIDKLRYVDLSVKSCMRTANLFLRQTAIQALIEEADDDKEYSFFIKTYLKLQGLIS